MIAGPTAAGKTAVAIELAQALQTSIISADSRQCYRELNIGVARPSEAELQSVPHYFIASHSITEKITAAYFETFALQKAEELFASNETVVMTGGTGLYIKAFCEGLDAIPPVPQEISEEVKRQYGNLGIQALLEAIEKEDPRFYKEGEIQNPHRLMRALEVVRASGQSILSFRTSGSKERPFRIIKLAIDLPREALYLRINRRVDAMMEAGLLDEVKSLMPFQELNALQTVGYAEWFDYLNGKCSYDEALSAVKQNTRHYAKRQLTWFRKDKSFIWTSASEAVATALRENQKK